MHRLRGNCDEVALEKNGFGVACDLTPHAREMIRVPLPRSHTAIMMALHSRSPDFLVNCCLHIPRNRAGTFYRDSRKGYPLQLTMNQPEGPECNLMTTTPDVVGCGKYISIAQDSEDVIPNKYHILTS